MWTFLRQQQQRGAQFPSGGGRQLGGAPDEATRDREAQDHEQAGPTEPAGNYPASNPPDRHGGDITPSAPDAADKQVNWDDIVQPEQGARTEGQSGENLPLPEGK